MKKVYIASPLFNEEERKFNEKIKSFLEKKYKVYLPQKDGLLLEDLIKEGVEIDSANRAIYNADINALKECDILLAILNGAHIDEGVAFEIGYMKGLGKDCIGYQSDIRRQLPLGNNPMIQMSLSKKFSNIQELLNWIEN